MPPAGVFQSKARVGLAEEGLDRADLAFHDFMPAGMPMCCDLRPLCGQIAFQIVGHWRGADRVAFASGDQDAPVFQSRLGCGLPRDQRVHQDEVIHDPGMREGDGGEDVGAVRVTKPDDPGCAGSSIG